MASPADGGAGTHTSIGAQDEEYRLLHPLPASPPGHVVATHVIEDEPGSPGRTLVFSDASDALELWDPVTGAKVGRLPGQQQVPVAVYAGPAGPRIATGSHNGTLRLWHGTTLAPLYDGQVAFDMGGIQAVQAYHDPRAGQSRLALRTAGRRVLIWAPPAQRVVLMVETPRHLHAMAVYTVGEGARPLLMVSDDGQMLRLHDLETGALIRESPLGFFAYNLMCYSPLANALETRVVAWGLSDVSVWEGERGRLIRQLQAAGSVRSVMVLPDHTSSRELLAVASPDQVQVFDVRSGEVVRDISLGAQAYCMATFESIDEGGPWRLLVGLERGMIQVSRIWWSKMNQ
jgi:WD40 repeat protein